MSGEPETVGKGGESSLLRTAFSVSRVCAAFPHTVGGPWEGWPSLGHFPGLALHWALGALRWALQTVGRPGHAGPSGNGAASELPRAEPAGTVMVGKSFETRRPHAPEATSTAHCPTAAKP